MKCLMTDDDTWTMRLSNINGLESHRLSDQVFRLSGALETAAVLPGFLAGHEQREQRAG